MKLIIKYMSLLIFSGLIISLPTNPFFQKTVPADIPIVKKQQTISAPAKSGASTLPCYQNILVKLFTH